MHTLTPLNSSLPHFPLPGSCNCGLKMKTDRPNLENSDQVGSTSDDQGATEVMSYKCSFCKRGFSNAQALGGHMNIHRRVRAKLKEPSNSTSLFSLDIMKNRQFFTGSNSLDLNSEQKGCTLGSPLIIPREGGGVVSREEIRTGEIRQLPLFVEMPSGGEDRKSVGCSGRSDESKMQSSDGSEGVELDLELRLGPEPQDTSRTGTKQFF